jgi:hypothetical protein
VSTIWPAVISGIVTIATVLITSYFNSRGIGKVHRLVNSNATDAQNRNDQLVRTLTDAGVSVPLTAEQSAAQAPEPPAAADA